ncbi:hypothetical protein E6O75_ATG05154 [Venturia nashicola]|uniref:Septation initiation network scaffold protein cdc11 n=1 Tax=Venturia nashicola TaxID=86259 RepID=A0A4Z1PIU5_9PEZI|nr:hypothetical protein E6O75_ATG05154 [Venturia nashicola]
MDWLDDLSEEWPSQPPSDCEDTMSNNKSQPHSSVPRPDGSTRRRSILTERSANRGTKDRRQGTYRSARRGLARRSLSAESNQSVIQHGTTARKSLSASPPKSRNTPEWKRRLLGGDMAYGEQKDLFSDMGIRSIFKPPPAAPAQPREKERSRGLSFLKSLDAIPSSPPTWNQDNTQSRRARLSSGSEPNLHAVYESDEESAQERRCSSQEQENQTREHSAMRQQPSFRRNPRISQGASSLASRPSSLGSVRLHPGLRNASQGASFQSEGSDFSPVFISKHNTSDGQVGYAALDLSKSQLKEHLRDLAESRASQQSNDTTRHVESSHVDESSLARLESENLPEDLPVGTPDVADVGEFVSIKRGGYSDEGSFRRRPLSPSPLRRPMSASTVERSEIRTSGLNRSEMDTPVVPPTAPSPPEGPRTPKQPRGEHLLSPGKNNPASPLKIFGNHDTFTSNKLQRRLSQLEDSIQIQVQPPSNASSQYPSRRNTQSRLPSVEEKSFQSVTQHELSSRHPSIEGYFGHGELDQYDFPEDEFHNDSQDQSEFSRSLQSLPSRSPSPDVLPPGSQQPFRFRVESPPPDMGDTFRGKRKLSRVSAKSTLSTISVNKRSIRSNKPVLDAIQDQSGLSNVSVSHVSDGKRPPTSPFKNPTPKRRRTLIQAEVQETAEQRTNDTSSVSIQETHQRFQSAIGKRKNARHESISNAAGPEILSRRHILRPRNPTPSQRARQDVEDELLDVAAEFASSSPRLEAIKEHLAVPTTAEYEMMQARAVASEVAAFSEKVAHGMKDAGRKRSVTTQDFLDEAMKIMSFIRNKGRPNNGLNSVMEDNSDQPSDDKDELSWDGPPAPLSLERPPTREGRRSGWRSREGEELDPSILSHLQQYQERDDDDFMSSSLRSSQHDHNVVRTGSRVETLESSAPGLHIIDRSPHLQSPPRSRSNSNRTRDEHGSVGTNGTNEHIHSSRTSMDSSLGRTTASRKSASENVATLAPDAVAHLIPEQIAGMTFDKEKNIWVKNKSPRKVQPTVEGPSVLSQSENDPFNDIPDLTVNEAEETKHLFFNRSQLRPSFGHAENQFATMQDWAETEASSDHEQDDHLVNLSYPDSKPSCHASTAKDSDSTTRATSWSHVKSSVESEHTDEALRAPVQASDGLEVEHEIKIHEGRTSQDQAHAYRDITVSISSPMLPREYKVLSPVLESPGTATRDFASHQPRAKPEPHKQKDPRQMSVSVRLSGTVSTKNAPSALAPVPSSSPCKGDLTFYMSELSEFTLHQADERTHPNRVIAKRNQPQAVEDRFADGNHHLVKALQDVEPEEPFWEELRQVDLHGRELTSLHLLDMFCERLEKLNISQNKVCQLIGAPSTIRSLTIRNNLLTSLTSWSHLTNLQYLDVSGNDIDSLEGFACLMHLRELRVDNNRITHLAGVECLDGLLTLSVKNNKLMRVNFVGYELNRLQSLDLAGNKLTKLQGLHYLPALTDLRLDDNGLEHFPQDDISCKQLRLLSLKSNHLASIDLAYFAPRLRQLHLDSNCLTSTSGISHLKHLRKLSLGSQVLEDGTLNLEPLLRAKLPELHTLSLCETHIPTLSMPTGWTSLRHLNLASCGLQSLPETFGLSVPNLRSLNLNFNAVKDLRPLLNISELSTLLVAGNRLSRLRKSAAVLAKLASLDVLDLRDNPFTVGFYAKAVEQRLVTTEMNRCDAEEMIEKGEEEEHDTFTVPPQAPFVDQTYFSRLDDGTKLRRRVYEMLIAASCKTLSTLDGKPFCKRDALVKDDIWERLVHLGVVRKSERGVLAVEGS